MNRSITLLFRWGWVAILALLTACGQVAAPAGTAPTSAPAASAPTIVPTPGPDEFRNPVLRADFPDPHVIRVGDTYYAYATNGTGKNVQLATSTDLVQWELQSDAMPALGSWAKLGGSFVWAPEVIQIDERFLLYYTARDKVADKQCIGVAIADKPEGKFRDPHDQPLVCQTDEGGTIDAHPFRAADGTLYLYYKNDGNCCSMPTYLYVQELAPDGLSLVGEPARLIRNERAWEGRVVEAPTMWLHEGSYYLFYSGNDYGGPPYAVGYALCETARGPCTAAPENPILDTTDTVQPPVIGPGHQTLITDADGMTWIVYHAWEVNSAGRRGSRRFLWIDRIVWNDGVPSVQGPTVDLQPRPLFAEP
jgi:beta-xylosidase